MFSSFGQPTGLPESLTIDEYEGDIGMYLVQFKAPMTPIWWQGLTDVCEIIGYYPQNTYLVRAAKSDLPVLRMVDGVQHVSLYQPAYKALRALLETDEQVVVDLQLDGGQDLDTARSALRDLTGDPVVVDRLGRYGYSRLRSSVGTRVGFVHRPEILSIEPALGIEPSGERQASIVAGSIDNGIPDRYDNPDPSKPDGHRGWLLDKGFCTPTDAPDGCWPYWTKVGVVDVGLDNIVCESGYDETSGICSDPNFEIDVHPDLDHPSNLPAACTGGPMGGDCEEAVVTGLFFCADSATDPPCKEGEHRWKFFDDLQPYGHGTSVASIIAGYPQDESKVDPGGVFLSGSGIAPSAQLIIAKYEKLYNADLLGGMRVPDYIELVKKIYSAGTGQDVRYTRFVNNSWNVTDRSGTYQHAYNYSFYSQIADRLVRDGYGLMNDSESDLTLVFSAGNYESTLNQEWVRAPANAKNVISVGASRGYSTANGDKAHEDCPDQDHAISDIAGGEDYSQPPGPDWHSQRGYRHEPAGPTNLPRYKPDLVAPGVQIAGARSGFFPDPLADYRCFAGTSAAAPAVTGAAVLADAWYYHKFLGGVGEVVASPALVKAMLVASADDLFGGDDHFDNSTLGHSPTVAQGWGRVNLDKLFQDEVGVVIYDQDHRTDGSQDRRFTGTGQSWSVNLYIDDPSEPVIAVMVLTDYPAQTNATSLMVNDLNLRVNQIGANPSESRRYFGNYFDTDGYSKNSTGPTSGPPYDHVNTVEMIRIEAGELQPWTFRVTVTGAVVNMKAVPGLDLSPVDLPNQDFALYIYNVEPWQ